MSEENSAGNNLIWAICLILIVAMVAGTVYYSGILNGNNKQQIDLKMDSPSSH